MRKLFLLLFMSSICHISSFATHNRAGEITYRWLGGFTYEVTITTYTFKDAPADRCTLEIFWGDTESSTLPRSNGSLGSCPSPARMGEVIAGGGDFRKNIYIGTHTYPSSGPYIVYFEDPNRVSGVQNIPQSVNVPFYVQSQIYIDPGLGGNSSPTLLNPPIDNACLNRRFEHNVGAFDVDGDSLSYRLVDCRGAGGASIPTTFDPQFVMDGVEIDSVTGDMSWDVPRNIGIYNFAIQIDEWRLTDQGQWFQIGYVVRDMQVNVQNCANQPPVITPVGPFCIEAGQTLTFPVTATDPDGDDITLTAFGGPFAVPTSPANPISASGSPPVIANFIWNTTCDHVRKQPYYVTFHAVDDPPNGDIPLTDIYTTNITVIAPSPKNPSATPNANSIQLNWDASICTDATGYKIYRREDSFGFIPSQCETGVPDYTGYVQIGTTTGLNSTTYEDTADVKRGVRYCYMVVACFDDGSESYASVEFCTALSLTLPLITKVDVTSTNTATGGIDVEWIFPPDLDSVNFPPPYSYDLYRADGIDGTTFTNLQSFPGNAVGSFSDNGLNTQDQGYTYRVDFFSGTPATLVGSSETASSVYLEVIPTDQSNFMKFNHNTPWSNERFVIYRETPTGSGNFDSIAESFSPSYLDTGLVNGDNYCYRVESVGRYTAPNPTLPSPLRNNSQIACGSPLDTTKPCSPIVNATFNCQLDSLFLQWTYPTDSGCVVDIVTYNIYYKPTRSSEFPDQPFATVSFPTNSFLIVGESITGCYAVTAVDDAGNDPNGESNESLIGNEVCVESCPTISFPNVFTPNSDDKNDAFIPISYRDIGNIELSVYNRWGVEVYGSSNLEDIANIGWDGTDQNTGNLCSESVYYYICRFTPLSLTGPFEQEVSGFVHLFR